MLDVHAISLLAVTEMDVSLGKLGLVSPKKVGNISCIKMKHAKDNC